MKQIRIASIIAVVLFAFVCAGRADFAEHVVYNMNETAYKAVVNKLGKGCSEYDIAIEYTNNRKYYDSLSE